MYELLNIMTATETLLSFRKKVRRLERCRVEQPSKMSYNSLAWIRDTSWCLSLFGELQYTAGDAGELIVITPKTLKRSRLAACKFADAVFHNEQNKTK